MIVMLEERVFSVIICCLAFKDLSTRFNYKCFKYYIYWKYMFDNIIQLCDELIKTSNDAKPKKIDLDTEFQIKKQKIKDIFLKQIEEYKKKEATLTQRIKSHLEKHNQLLQLYQEYKQDGNVDFSDLDESFSAFQKRLGSHPLKNYFIHQGKFMALEEELEQLRNLSGNNEYKGEAIMKCEEQLVIITKINNMTESLQDHQLDQIIRVLKKKEDKSFIDTASLYFNNHQQPEQNNVPQDISVLYKTFLAYLQKILNHLSPRGAVQFSDQPQNFKHKRALVFVINVNAVILVDDIQKKGKLLCLPKERKNYDEYREQFKYAQIVNKHHGQDDPKFVVPYFLKEILQFFEQTKTLKFNQSNVDDFEKGFFKKMSEILMIERLAESYQQNEIDCWLFFHQFKFEVI